MVGNPKEFKVGAALKNVGHLSSPAWHRALRGVGYDELRNSIYNAAGNLDLVAQAAKRWANDVGAPKRPAPQTSRIEDELARLRGDLKRAGR